MVNFKTGIRWPVGLNRLNSKKQKKTPSKNAFYCLFIYFGISVALDIFAESSKLCGGFHDEATQFEILIL